MCAWELQWMHDRLQCNTDSCSHHKELFHLCVMPTKLNCYWIRSTPCAYMLILSLCSVFNKRCSFCWFLLRLHSKRCSAYLNNNYWSVEHSLSSSVKFHLLTSFHAQIWLQGGWLSLNCQKLKRNKSQELQPRYCMAYILSTSICIIGEPQEKCSRPQDFFYDLCCPCPTPKSPPAFLIKSPK